MYRIPRRRSRILSALCSITLAVALSACASPSVGQSSDSGQPRGGQRPSPPDFEAAAGKLGVSADELRAALGGPPPNIDGAAAALGISSEALTEALGMRGGPRP